MNGLRYALVVGGVLILVAGLGFAFQLPIVTAAWPWPDGPLSYLFVGSILAAFSVAMLWIGWSGELGALPAASLNVLVAAIAVTSYFIALTVDGHPELIAYDIAGILWILLSASAFLWSRKIPLRDERPTPVLVRISFAIFVVALVLAGGALVFRLPIFPWEVLPDSSVVFGCIFLGDAFYFLYGLLIPRWHNALGQLLSFLAYDVVLIVPFLVLLTNVSPEHMLSLVIYLAVLIYSGAISIFFLFINRHTSNWPNPASTRRAQS